MIYTSDSPLSGLDKIIDEFTESEINDKDLVIPRDKIYNYLVVLEKVRGKMSTGTRSQ